MDSHSQPLPAVVRRSEVLAGLSYALDLTEGQRAGHAVRSCLIGMRIAEVLGLRDDERSSLFYALLMKDLGCSSNAARFAALFGADDRDLKARIKEIDWTKLLESFRFVVRSTAPGEFLLKRTWRLLAVMVAGQQGARDVVRTRCERGADIARMLGLTTDTAQAIRALDEHWDGRGQPYGKRGEEIPFLARILGLAQTVEVFFTTHGADRAFEIAASRRGTWFDPTLVDAMFTFRHDRRFWSGLGVNDLDRLKAYEPIEQTLDGTDERLDTIATAFGKVIDAKSPWTFRHSTGVAEIAVAMAERMGMSAGDVRQLRRSALLHDLGKLGVSNLILDKPDKLTDVEFRAMQRHTEYTAEILGRVSCFAPLVEDAASHHEKLNGRGYHRGLTGEHLSPSARILAVADICDALRASRPYRQGLPTERVLEIIEREAGTSLDADCVAALRHIMTGSADGDAAAPARVVTSLAEDYSQAA
jgi:putative nucleotidyltransferase with HDIG domain